MGRYSQFAVAFGALVVGIAGAGAAVVWLRDHVGLLLPAVAAAALAGLIAIAIAWRFLPVWWRPVIGLAPLGLLSLVYVNPWLFLAAAVLLATLQWNAIANRIPLYRSGSEVVDCIATHMRAQGYNSLLDLGCGDGRLLQRLAIHMPEAQFTGIESAPVLYLLARWRCRHQVNCHVVFGDFWKQSWMDFDVVFSFLSPEPMVRVWRKARREMPSHSALMSLAFPVPELDEDLMLEAGGFDLFVYSHEAIDKTDQEMVDAADPEGNW